MVTEHLFHYPLAVLGLIGIYRWIAFCIAKRTLVPMTAGIRLACTLFACIFLPMLASLTDAFELQRSVKTVFSYLHFLPAVLYVSFVFKDRKAHEFVLIALSLCLALLVADALIQFVFGVNLLGYPRDSAVLTGMFDSNQRLGLVLALFLPLLLYVLHFRCRWAVWKWLLLIPYAVVILFSLKRSAWVMLLVGAILFFVTYLRYRNISLRAKIATPLFVLLLVFITANIVPSVGTTIRTTFSALTADYETLDIATSRRLTLWRTGRNIFVEHALNGIGPRGYRYAYRGFAEEDDFWIKQGSKGQTHPHLMGLEVAVETGLVGLIGLLCFFGLVVKAGWSQRQEPIPTSLWFILALVAWFPFNTHLAFYGSYWSTFAWLFIALGCAGLNINSQKKLV